MGQRITDFIIEKVDKVGEIEEENQIKEIVEAARDRFKTKCDYFFAGGFVGPGYDIDCYIIAFLDDEGEIQGVPANIERY